MNTFKSLLLAASVVVLAPVTALAEEVTYQGALSGVECTACKRTISRAIGKLDGVLTIRIIKQTEDKHRLEVITDGTKAISKGEAEKALKKAEHYKILSWSKAQS